jgi:hypothetical protein
MPSVDPTLKRLRDEIAKTGKPLEIRISSLLDNKWPDVINQDTYYDKSRVLREIDIRASIAPIDIGNLELEANLIIECKKSEAFSWVFFTRPYRRFEVDDIAGQYLDEVQMAAKNTGRTEIMFELLKDARLHYSDQKRVGVTYEAFQTGDPHKSQFKEDKGATFEAVSQLRSYVECSNDEDIRIRVPVLPYTIQMSFPCIVFRGSMYEAVVEGNDLGLEKTNHLVLKATFSSAYSIYEKGLLVDIVSEEYFNDYQELIRKDISYLEKRVRKKSDIISSRITEMMSLLESIHKG